MTWLADLLEAYRRVRANEYERQEEIRARLAAIHNPWISCGFHLECVSGVVPRGLSWRESDELERVTIGEYRGPWRPFWGSRSGR
mgnify:CR=1 FL=1